MFKNKWVLTGIAGAVLLAGMAYFSMTRSAKEKGDVLQEITPRTGDIRLSVETTGAVQPQNRLEIKPSINGRIEDVLVKEGDAVKKGQILAWMSSTERAALIDAATSQGEKERQYWEDVYKKTPIISPIDGEVIVRTFEPGQTVTTNDAILVLSDRLIVKAQFDETDIGHVKVGQAAVIALDAYPNTKIDGTVDHIAYESEVINNVTIYNVDIVPQTVPDFFRSGMSANVEVIEKSRTGVLLVPVAAIKEEKEGKFVMVKKRLGGTERRRVEVGVMDTNNAEILSGLSPSDIVMSKSQKYSPVRGQEAGTNPFLPSRRRQNDRNQ